MKTLLLKKEDIKIITIFEAISQRDWVIKGWTIHFLFSEKKLHQVKKLSTLEIWYKDPVVIHSCIDRLQTCFKSIHRFYQAFGVLPQVGDRLFDEDSGMIIQDRSIDGDLMVISFTLSI
ncbi:hypothetical protein [Spirosoma flavum]|uniref:Uncharacterized protein n=1 Tax=Spirosoma flavum TaxID=2048557 RepID=A0ABW6AW81_9BACT